MAQPAAVLSHLSRQLVSPGRSKELFDQMDTDSNGAINKEEFRNYLLVKFGDLAENLEIPA